MREIADGLEVFRDPVVPEDLPERAPRLRQRDLRRRGILLEMQLLGTTAILDMGTVRFHEIVFEEAERSGMRYWGGNCLMDKKSNSGPLYRPTLCF